ncbi:MAG: alpha/beta hydrolase [Sphingobacteriales bacterium]|nr:alpha/beta hydrolase [Sphingobacteriales bacterium]MBI3719885.1 alpha/beta hydrolase [Sphingobacteriales bacterium]
MRNLLLPFLFLISLKSSAQNIVYGNNKAAGKYYTFRGIKMYCEIYGKGEPLLMIHGNGGSISDFRMNIGYFSKYFKVIVPDMRSQGKTKDVADSLSYEMMADDIAVLMDTLKIDSANILGWSDGGNDGLLLAMYHSKKVKKLAITGANLWPGTSAIVESSVNGDKKRLAELDKISNKSAAEKNEYKLLSMMQVQPNIAIEDLSAIKCPTLVIAGDHDLIRPEHTLLIYQNIPKAYLWIVPNSTHSTLQDQRDAFNKTVHDFFIKPFHSF